MLRTRMRAETVPIGLLIASGIFERSCRADPVLPYLGVRCLSLKSAGNIFKLCGDCGYPLVKTGGKGGRRLAFPQFMQFVGKKQCREQQHPALILAADAPRAFELGFDHAAELGDVAFFSVRASDREITPSDQ